MVGPRYAHYRKRKGGRERRWSGRADDFYQVQALQTTHISWIFLVLNFNDFNIFHFEWNPLWKVFEVALLLDGRVQRTWCQQQRPGAFVMVDICYLTIFRQKGITFLPVVHNSTANNTTILKTRQNVFLSTLPAVKYLPHWNPMTI